VIVLRYEGDSGKGKIITDSGPIPNGQGFYTLKIADDWLKGEWNQSARIIISPSKMLQEHPGPFLGPHVFLQRDEHGEPPVDKEEEERRANRLKVSVAIPFSIFGVVCCLWAWFCISRRVVRIAGMGLKSRRRKISRRGGRGVPAKYEMIEEGAEDDDIDMPNMHERGKRED